MGRVCMTSVRRRVDRGEALGRVSAIEATAIDVGRAGRTGSAEVFRKSRSLEAEPADFYCGDSFDCASFLRANPTRGYPSHELFGCLLSLLRLLIFCVAFHKSMCRVSCLGPPARPHALSRFVVRL